MGTALRCLKPDWKETQFVLQTGHYISDVYDMKKQSWLTYNDEQVSRTLEATVQRDRDRSGYIFFYMHKWVAGITDFIFRFWWWTPFTPIVCFNQP